MSDSINHPNVIGNDGVRPAWHPDGGWRILALHQTWLGENGGIDIGGQIVPLYVARVNDYLENVFTHETFQVKSLDERFVPTYEPIVRNANSLSQKDMLTALGTSFGVSDHKITIDTSVYPHRLDVSPFLHILSVEARYAKIVQGSIRGDHRVVGFLQSPSGALVDDKIPLDLVKEVSGGVTNYQVKTVQVCYTNIKVKNGDTLGVALYSAAGNFLSETQLVVVDSGFMRDGTAPQDFIDSVYIESPYLSPDNPFELQLPLNWNNSSLNMVGVVSYQSGKKVRLPIDNNKFKLEGMNQLLSSIPGQRCDMTLRYALDRSENTLCQMSAFSNSIPRPYRCIVTKANNSYSVKLYIFPVWDKVTSSYRLKYYIFNLERNLFTEVTSSVRHVTGTPMFDGNLTGATQRLQVSLNLRDVVGTFKPFVHTQAFEVSLYGTPDEFEAPWTVRQTNLDPKPFGTGLFAKRSFDTTTLNISCGIKDFDEWKRRLIKESYPLLSDPRDVDSYPEPTHFTIMDASGFQREFHVEEWDQDLSFGTAKEKESINILWTYKNVGQELHVSMSSLIVVQSYD